jgi:REP element-mobilizing transposase RayT
MNEKFRFEGRRSSFMDLETPYFWTSTINHWHHLLRDDEFKWIIINSLQWLCKQGLIAVYGFVIMPNHLHLLWEQLKMNGKEYPKNSLNKFTAHRFLAKLRSDNAVILEKFRLQDRERNYLFWQRDPLAIIMNSRETTEQKLRYIHNNPLQEHWNLCNNPALYRFSSAAFYETGKDEFGILSHYIDRF